MNLFQITSARGVPFNLRIVRHGDRYGLRDCLTHDSARPMVEFYDARYTDAQGFTPRGQFVSRYFVRTLLDGSASGLMLEGSEREWDIDGATMARVRDYLRGFMDGLES